MKLNFTLLCLFARGVSCRVPNWFCFGVHGTLRTHFVELDPSCYASWMQKNKPPPTKEELEAQEKLFQEQREEEYAKIREQNAIKRKEDDIKLVEVCMHPTARGGVARVVPRHWRWRRLSQPTSFTSRTSSSCCANVVQILSVHVVAFGRHSYAKLF